MTTRRFLCIHGHFYQPPRENPWLEVVEVQDSAYPHHDWNARITAECYTPNATSRILDEHGLIRRIVNNYAHISFNFGPTLLKWLEDDDPGTYDAILEADRLSQGFFGGHGSAMAQPYNHMIMPLANERDKRTQVHWGLVDFRHRFGREPEGMWLPEAAVDEDTLEVLVDAGIRFTVLAPHQAGRVRALGDQEWRDVTGGKVDPKRPYVCRLPSGRSIVLFFYDGPVSRGVAFENLLDDGGRFADRLLGLFPDRPAGEAATRPVGSAVPIARGAGGEPSRSAGRAGGPPDSTEDEGEPARPTPRTLAAPSRMASPLQMPGAPKPRSGDLETTGPAPATKAAAASKPPQVADVEARTEASGAAAPSAGSATPDEGGDTAMLVHIATDGETYGHHHGNGDMALAYALAMLESSPTVQVTNYGEYLAHNPPAHEVELASPSSWSCIHGVERWRADCGCTTGDHSEWNQQWRGPLREAYDHLRDALEPHYVREAQKLFHDPWAARDDYIEVILDRDPPSLATFFEKHAVPPLDATLKVRALKLLELQRHLMLMYTSCGWFFEELSRIETVQAMQYAGRALQLAEELFDAPFTDAFRSDLAAAKSNLPEQGDGAQIFDRNVRPAAVDLPWVAGHYALSSLFTDYDIEDRLYAFIVRQHERDVFHAGRSRLAMGRITVRSIITLEQATFTYAVVHVGDQALHGGVRAFDPDASEDDLNAIRTAFEEMDLTQSIRLVDRAFPVHTYSLRNLFRDEQRRIVDTIVEDTIEGVETTYKRIYDQHAPLMRFLSNLSPRLPRVFATTAEFVVNSQLRHALEADPLDLDAVIHWLDVAKRDRLRLEEEGLAQAMRQGLEERMAWFAAAPDDMERLHTVVEGARLLDVVPFDIDLRLLQDTVYHLHLTQHPHFEEAAEAGHATASGWLDRFRDLSQRLKVRLEP